MMYAAHRMRQISLFPPQLPVHGGDLNQGRRKTRRPLAQKRPLHLVLKAKKRVLFANRQKVEALARRQAEKAGLKINDIAIPADHVHLILTFPSRKAYVGFVRALTGLLARYWGKGFWLCLPFTRVLTWGKDYLNMRAYLKKNREEAAGVREYEPRKDWYAKLRGKGKPSR